MSCTKVTLAKCEHAILLLFAHGIVSLMEDVMWQMSSEKNRYYVLTFEPMSIGPASRSGSWLLIQQCSTICCPFSCCHASCSHIPCCPRSIGPFFSFIHGDVNLQMSSHKKNGEYMCIHRVIILAVLAIYLQNNHSVFGLYSGVLCKCAIIPKQLNFLCESSKEKRGSKYVDFTERRYLCFSEYGLQCIL